MHDITVQLTNLCFKPKFYKLVVKWFFYFFIGDSKLPSFLAGGTFVLLSHERVTNLVG